MEERASSKEIRKVIREAVESFGLSEVSDIKAFINQRLGKTYTSGQLSGSFTNMCKSGELINVERGFYKIGPDFQKKAGYYKKHEFLYEGGLPENTEGEITSKEEIASKEEIISKEENAGQKSFFKTREEVGRILRTSSQEVEKMINELKIGDIGPKDFPFVAELRELTNTISAFCEKYKIG